MRDQPTGVEARVCEDIAARQRLGIAKYGVTVEQSGDDMLWHAYEEATDMATYLRAEWERRQWRPIDTAPRDGTHILAAVQWSDEYTQTVIHWACDCWQLVQTGGYATDGDPDGRPTHWMPLPPPPKP